MTGLVASAADDWHTTNKGCMSIRLECGGFGVRIFQRAPGGSFYRMVLAGGQQEWKSLGTKDQQQARQLGEQFVRAFAEAMLEGAASPDVAVVESMSPSTGATSGEAMTSSTSWPAAAAQVPVVAGSVVRPLTYYQLWRRFRRSSYFLGWSEKTREDLMSRARVLLAGMGKHHAIVQGNGPVFIRRVFEKKLEAYEAARKKGGIEYQVRTHSRTGRCLGTKKRESRPAEQRSVQADLGLLHAMIHWALVEPDLATGTMLLEFDPMQGYAIEAENNPRQPTATQQRYEATLTAIGEEVAELESDRHRVTFKRTRTRLHLLRALRDSLVVGEGTGRRIDCVLAMDWADVHFGMEPDFSDGFIHFPSETDKRRRDSAISVQEHVLRVLHERRATVGGSAARGPVFLAPNGKRRLNRDNMARLLLEMEERAELKKLSGSLFHAYRRKFATERQHLAAQVVMELMGITDMKTFRDSYCKTTTDAMREVAAGARPNTDLRLEHARPRRGEGVHGRRVA